MDNRKNFKITKLGKFKKFRIGKIPKNVNLKNYKNFRFVKFQKFHIRKLSKISKTFKFQKSPIFWNCSISKNRKFSKFYKLKNHQNPINFQFYNLSYILNILIIRTNIKIRNKFENKTILSLFKYSVCDEKVKIE